MNNKKERATTRAIQANDNGWLTRSRALTLILILATALALYLCFLLARPFFPALAWALALAVIAYPLHRAIARRIANRDVAATLTCLAVALIIVTPALFVGQQLGREAGDALETIKEKAGDARWKSVLERNAALAPVLTWIEDRVDVKSELEEAVKAGGARVPGVIKGSIWAVMQLLITFLVLYYFFRDRDKALNFLRTMSPLTEKETAQLLRRLSETIRGTVFGTLVVALVQGTLGGLMFWWLGLPAPLLWGAVMGLLAIVPVLGAFVVWVPAAIFLALEGDWGKAAILAAWGAIVISLIDNVLYPILVGNKLRMHTLPVFFAIVGGLVVFGSSGLILGPVVLAVAVALLEVWRDRTRAGHTVDEG